jgi:hypothetical protein
MWLMLGTRRIRVAEIAAFDIRPSYLLDDGWTVAYSIVLRSGVKFEYQEPVGTDTPLFLA